MKMFGKTLKRETIFFLAVAFFLTALNSLVVAQTNPLDSTPSKNDIFTQEQLVQRLGAVRKTASTTNRALSFTVDKNYPSLYVIPADKRPQIMDQGQCGACVAYATSATLSTMLYQQPTVLSAIGNNVKNNVFPDPMMLFNGGGRKCAGGGGWDNESAATYLTQNDVPVDLDAGLLKMIMPNVVIKAGKTGTINDNTPLPAGVTKIDAMRKFIATQGALATGFTVFPSFNRYQSGIYNHKKFNDNMLASMNALKGFGIGMDTASIKAGLEKPLGGHAVMVIGYFTGGKLKAADFLAAMGLPNPLGLFNNTEYDLPAFWVVQNSWGSKWGIHGLFLIEANQPDLGFEDEMQYLLDPVVKRNGVALK